MRRYVRGRRGIPSQQRGADDEGKASDEITANLHLPAADGVDEEEEDELRDFSNGRIDALVEQRLARGDADLREDCRREVLDRGNTRHLAGGLDGAGEDDAARVGLVLEELFVCLGGVEMLVGQLCRDDFVFGLDVCVGGVSIRMQSCEGLEPFLVTVVVN